MINTALFLPFIRPLESLILRALPGSSDEDELEHELVYLTTPFGSAPELAISSARKEVDRMAGIVLKMMSRVQQAITAEGSERERLLRKIRRHEQSTDILEHEIGQFLADLIHGQLSTQASRQTLSLISMINDLERIGDKGEKISYLLERESENKPTLAPDAIEELLEMAQLTLDDLAEMRRLILDPEENPIPAAIEREEVLNRKRYELRDSYLKRMEDGSFDAPTGVIFIDIATSFEMMGDHSFNVIEATAGLK